MMVSGESSMFVVYTFGAIFLIDPSFSIAVLRADPLLSDVAITISCIFCNDEFLAILSINRVIQAIVAI